MLVSTILLSASLVSLILWPSLATCSLFAVSVGLHLACRLASTDPKGQ